jgi:hypothetical protein
VYAVLSGFSLTRCILICISMTLSNMSDDLPPHPNVVIKLSLCLHMYYEIDVDDEKYLYQKLFNYTCMLSIGCKPMILITLNMAKTCLKVIKAICCRHMNHLLLEALASLEVDYLVMSGHSC